MKYGLIIYKETENLGDDVQSYAASRFLPSVDYIIDRENVDVFIPNKKEYVATIMNAWWLNSKYNWPPSPYVYPLLISMHFTHWDTVYNLEFKHITGYGLEYLKKYNNIGCRDEVTLQLLKNRGVDAYLSGCLTLTLQKKENIYCKERFILLVDVSETIANEVKKRTEKKIVKFSNKLDKEKNKILTWDERRKNVEEYLLLIQNADLVITSRLHCALPALALETPVILIETDASSDRTKTFFQFLNHTTEEKFVKNKNIYDINNPEPNSNKYMKMRESLINTCNRFIEKCEKESLGNEGLPNCRYYNDFVKRLQFEKQLILDSYNNLREKYEEALKENQKVWNSRNILQEQYDELYKKVIGGEK